MIQAHKKLIAVISIIFFIMVLLCCGIYSLVDNMGDNAIKESIISPVPVITATPDPTPISTKKTPAPKPKVYNFIPGNYVAGKDFDPGTYDILAIGGKGNVYSSNIFDGGLNDIMASVKDEYYSDCNKNIRFRKGVELTSMGVTIKMTKKD